MEIALPLLALGGFYVISNKDKTLKKETFVPMGATKYNNGINVANTTSSPEKNYPVANTQQIAHTVQHYPNPNAPTDKYFVRNDTNNQTLGERQISSLSGQTTNFNHMNMNPLSGSKVRGQIYDMNMAETVLDNLNGSGSQQIRKTAQAPLFKPEENMQWAYGAPNQSDFYQSRVNAVQKNSNVKPFDSIMVGPGLDQGYGVGGHNGFNSGMESRDKWMPKTADEMRVATNPKLEYELSGHEGPGISAIKNITTAQQQGRVEKYRPDTFYINTQDRWFTTGGVEKGPTLRSEQELGILKRPDGVVNYTGPATASNVQAASAPQNYEPSRRQEPTPGNVGPSNAIGKGPNAENNMRQSSITNYHNNRSTVRQPDTFRSGFSGAIGAVVAPLLDVFKPTKKDETINNVRVYGDIGGSALSKGPVYNPYDTVKTTNKETTLYAPTFNINNQKEGMYINNQTTPGDTQRDTTSVEYYTAAGGASTGYGAMDYGAAYQQHNNDIKSQTIHGRTAQGGTQIFNQQMHVSISKSDEDRFDGRMNPAFMKSNVQIPSVQTYGNLNKQFLDDKANTERLNPEILSALKSNPYAFSVNSCA